VSRAIELYRAHDSRIFTMIVLQRMRAEWLLWLAFTASLDPYNEERSIAARSADALLCAQLAQQTGGGEAGR
jgi:hypothetical protein